MPSPDLPQKLPDQRAPLARDARGGIDDESVSSATSARRHATGGLVFKIHGMDCAEEIAALRREVGPMVGGADNLDFDLLNGRMRIAAGAPVLSADVIRNAVARTGMRAEPVRADQPAPESGIASRRRMAGWLTAASGAFVVVGVVLHAWAAGSLAAAVIEGESVPLPARLAYAAAIVCGARFVAVKAWYALRRLRPDMNLLMTIAVTGAIGIGDWLEAATVAFLFALSLALEGWSVGRARRAIVALLELAPSRVHVVADDGSEREMPADELAVGARFVVKPGERIPLDGVVVAGSSTVNQAPITGESLPVVKGVDDDVFAGTINGDGALTVESSRRAEETTLAQIIRQVEEAQSRRSPSEQWVEKFARVYTPVVMAMALFVGLLPPLAFGAAWGEWFYRALVLLVIACPCALVISTPVSIVAALAASARAGVLVKGGAFIELPARLRAMALDKTGTLSEGRPVVQALLPLQGHSEEELLARAAALEARSSHPLARAIVEYANMRGVAPAPAEDVQAFPGKGVRGKFEDREFWLGSHRYLEERGQETAALHDRAEAFERQGRTVVAIGNDTHVCGLLAIADAIRPEAAEAIDALRRAGIEHVLMLTGDNRVTAENVGRRVGVDAIRAELLPVDKVAAVEALVGEYGTVAMVGDGVNDAPALASASLGIAMGAAGSDAAIEAADVALMSDDLSKLPWLVAHSRRTLAVIRQNIAFSLAVKATFVVLTFAGLASLWGAIAADTGASLIVVANGLRLLRSERCRNPDRTARTGRSPSRE